MALVKVPPVALANYSLICSYISLGFFQATLEPHLRSFDLSPIMTGIKLNISTISIPLSLYPVCHGNL